MDFSKFDIFNKRATIVVDNKYRAFVVTGSRKDKHGKIIFDCRTIDAHPQQRVLEVKNVKWFYPLLNFQEWFDNYVELEDEDWDMK